MPTTAIPINVFATERSRVPIGDPAAQSPVTNAHYDVPIMPRIPLHIGLAVSITALHRCRNPSPTPEADLDEDTPCYTSVETDVEGKIVGVRALEKNITELIVENRDRTTATAYAYLAIHHVEGKTVHLPLWLRALRATLHPLLPATRDIPIETDARIRPAPDRRENALRRNGPKTTFPSIEEWLIISAAAFIRSIRLCGP